MIGNTNIYYTALNGKTTNIFTELAMYNEVIISAGERLW